MSVSFTQTGYFKSVSRKKWLKTGASHFIPTLIIASLFIGILGQVLLTASISILPIYTINFARVQVSSYGSLVVSNPTVSQAGIGNVTVSFSIRNSGDVAVKAPIILVVDGIPKANQTITVNGHGLQNLNFVVVGSISSSYSIQITGSIPVTLQSQITSQPSTVGSLIVGSLTVTPNSNGQVTVSFNVRNSGDVPFGALLTLLIDGAPKANQTVTVGGHGTLPVNFFVSGSTSSKYSMEVTGTPTIVTPPPQTPNIVGSVLIGSLSVIQTSNGQVKISFNVRNSGDVPVRAPLSLLADGAIVATQVITVNGHGLLPVNFIVAGSVSANYTVQESGILPYISTPTTPAAFTYGIPRLILPSAAIGEMVSVSTNITNTGQLQGVYSAQLKVDGKANASKSDILGPGASTTVVFSLTFQTEGTHTISIENKTASIVISKPAQSSQPTQTTSPANQTHPNFTLLYLGVSAFAIIVVAFFVLLKRRS